MGASRYINFSCDGIVVLKNFETTMQAGKRERQLAAAIAGRVPNLFVKIIRAAS